MRLCPACLKEKDESEFYNDTRRRKCKVCEKAKTPLQIRLNTPPSTMKELKEREGEPYVDPKSEVMLEQKEAEDFDLPEDYGKETMES